MTTRREFIQRIAMASFGLAAGNVYARQRADSPVVFTKLVRKRTNLLAVRPGRWKWIVVHHSAIKYGNAAIYDKAHRKRGMENGLAYHFVIGNGIDSSDGEIEIGNRWLKQLDGGHVRRDDINKVGIGICLVGNFEQRKPTSKQLLAFRELVEYLRSDVVGKIRFAGHKEIDPRHTGCPGRYFPTAEMHRLFDRFPVKA